MAQLAIIPKDMTPTLDKQEGWLSMEEADKLVCEFFGEEVDPKYYCHGWFDRLWPLAWPNVKHMSRNNLTVSFPTLGSALFQCLYQGHYHESIDGEFWRYIEEKKDYVQKYIEPILKLFYDRGYKIVSLNLA